MINLDGKTLKEKKLTELKNKVFNLNLSLAVIQVGNDEASTIYIKQKEKMCNALNINFKKYLLDENVTNEEIINLINKLNNDDTTGILVQLPLPRHLDEYKIINSIDYRKDIDGLTDYNFAKLMNNQVGIVPCTPKGIEELLDEYNIELEGKNVVIIGRSNLVGKPLYNLLLNKDATVTICHSKTKDLKEHTQKADILVIDIGKPNYITKDYIKNGCIIIDVGISRLDNKVVGDADYNDIKDKVSYITPVPGGVGPMTIAALAENIYLAYQLQNK